MRAFSKMRRGLSLPALPGAGAVAVKRTCAANSFRGSAEITGMARSWNFSRAYAYGTVRRGVARNAAGDGIFYPPFSGEFGDVRLTCPCPVHVAFASVCSPVFG